MRELGCFGMPSTHDPEADVCKACCSYVVCGKIAHTVLVALRDAAGSPRVTDALMLPHTPQQSEPSRLTRINAAPKKVQPRLAKLLNKGFDRLAREAFESGRNPFPQQKSKVLWLMGEQLLEGGIERSKVRDWCELNLLWSRAAAQSQVSNEVALLRGLGLVEENDKGLLVLSQHPQAEINA